MGLNSEFDIIRSQILNLDPLPKVSKAFSMVASAESQKVVSQSISDPTVDASALFAKSASPKSDVSKPSTKKRDPSKKSDKYCDHCGIGDTLRTLVLKFMVIPIGMKNLRNQRNLGLIRRLLLVLLLTVQ